MQKLSFLHFIKQLLLHPVKFTDIYFKDKKSPTPYLRTYAWRTYIGGSIVISLLSWSADVMKDNYSIEIFLISLVPLVLTSYVGALIGYILYRWLLKKALHLSGATIPEKRIKEIALYLLSFDVLFFVSLLS